MPTYRVTVAPGGQVFDVRHGERILAAARRAGIWLPFECGWGSCGTCKATLVEGDVELLFADCPSVNERDARRRRTVTCQTTPTSDIVIKPNWAESAPRLERPTADYQARLTHVDMLGPQLRKFTFELDQPIRDSRTGRRATTLLFDVRPSRLARHRVHCQMLRPRPWWSSSVCIAGREHDPDRAAVWRHVDS